MKLKNFLKSANRGVILGAILVVIVAIYVVADNITFQNETDDIVQVTQDYLDDYFKCIVAADDVVKNNGWAEDTYSKQLSEFSELIDTYFTYNNYKDSVSSMTYYTDRSEGEEYIKMLQSDFSSNYGYITDADHSVHDLKVKKYGPNGAVISFTVEYSLNCTGNPELINPCLEYVGLSNEYDDDSEESSEKEMKSIIYDCSADCEFILIRENGRWKLSMASNTGTEMYSRSGGDE